MVSTKDVTIALGGNFEFFGVAGFIFQAGFYGSTTPEFGAFVSGGVGVSQPTTNAGTLMVNVRQGSSGQLVKDLQTMLNFTLASRPELSVDGIFGPKTNARVIEFQKSAKVSADGIVGPITARALLTAITSRVVNPRR
jgi:peptidoglycan hydrolase-like protein with peptidoglycan-binding domain